MIKTPAELGESTSAVGDLAGSGRAVAKGDLVVFGFDQAPHLEALLLEGGGAGMR
jgi:hypothetical protein